MPTTRNDIRAWLKEAEEKGATHLIVATDDFGHDDYPIYVMPGEDPHVRAQRLGDMQRVMEVYAMHLDLGDQLAERRSFHYESAEETARAISAGMPKPSKGPTMPGPGPAPKQPPPKKPTAEQEIETLTRAKAEWEAAYHGARSEIETMRVGLTIAENDLAKALAKNADLASRVGKLELALQVNRGAATTHKEMVEKMVGSAREMIEQAQAVIKEQTATMASQREQIGKLLDMNKQLIEMAPRRETRSTLGNPVLGEE